MYVNVHAPAFVILCKCVCKSLISVIKLALYITTNVTISLTCQQVTNKLINDVQVNSKVISLNSKSSPKSPGFTKSSGFTKSHGCGGLSVVVLVANLGGYYPVTALANHNKYFISIVFDEACYNNIVLFCVRLEPPNLLASHKLASQVKSQTNDVKINSQVIPLNSS